MFPHDRKMHIIPQTRYDGRVSKDKTGVFAPFSRFVRKKKQMKK
jgi:hypothetical protein